MVLPPGPQNEANHGVENSTTVHEKAPASHIVFQLPDVGLKARRSECFPKNTIGSRHSDFMLRIHRLICAFKFGLLGGGRTTFVPVLPIPRPGPVPTSSMKHLSGVRGQTRPRHHTPPQ